MPRLADIMLTAEELRLRSVKRRRIFIAVFSLLLVIAIVVFAGHPIAGAIKGWQSRRHASRVVPFLEKQQWSEARNEALAAYQLRPNEPEALRAVARYLSRTRQHQALEFWEQLAKRQPLTRDDLRDEATVALMSDETERASPIIRSLIDRKDAGPPDWFLGTQLALQKGNGEEAQSYLQKILGDRSASEREQLQAIVAELAISSSDDSASAANRANALARLEKLSRGKSEVALDALVVRAQRALSGSPLTINQEQITPSHLAKALENHPLAKAPQKLLALDLAIQADPSQKDALISRGIANWKNADAESLATLATWLNGKGEYQRNIDAIPLEKALQTREVFLQHVDALGALGRWSDIKQLLEGERFPLDAVMQRMYLARCYAQLGEKTASANNWQRAIEAAGNDVQKLLLLADYAEKNGALDIAETAYTAATAEMPKLRAAQQGRLRVAQAQRDTKRIHAVLADMLKLWPNDTAIQNDEAYTRLLLLGNDAAKDEGRRMKEEGRKSEHGEAGLSRVDGNAAQGSGAELAAKHQDGDGRARSPSAPVPDSEIVNSQLKTSLPEGENKSEGQSNSAIRDPKSEIPADPITKNQELITIERLAQTLIKREPTSLPHRTLLALALLKQNRPVAALDVYSNINVAPNALSPSALAVHAAVLEANDRHDDAAAEIQQVNLDQLLPEEKALVADSH